MVGGYVHYHQSNLSSGKGKLPKQQQGSCHGTAPKLSKRHRSHTFGKCYSSYTSPALLANDGKIHVAAMTFRIFFHDSIMCLHVWCICFSCFTASLSNANQASFLSNSLFFSAVSTESHHHETEDQHTS